MIKLSARMKGKTRWDEPISDEQVEDWGDEVAQLESQNAALLEALDGLLNYSFWPDKPEVHLEFMSAEERVAYEAIRSA